MDLVGQLVARDLAGWDLAAMELFQECPSGQVGKLSGLSLRDDTLGVPLNRRGDTHLSRKLPGREAQRAEGRCIEVEADRGGHGCIMALSVYEKQVLLLPSVALA
jgi:hypothetical protein